jgi:hypothetical protein
MLHVTCNQFTMYTTNISNKTIYCIIRIPSQMGKAVQEKPKQFGNLYPMTMLEPISGQSGVGRHLKKFATKIRIINNVRLTYRHVFCCYTYARRLESEETQTNAPKHKTMFSLVNFYLYHINIH